MKTKTIIHLLSGGVDSTVLLYDLIGQDQRVHALMFDYGQAHSIELTYATRHCERLGVLYTKMKLPQLKGSVLTDGKEGVVVPGRNIIFLSVALNLAIEAKADLITIGCNKDDEALFPDCRSAFIQAFNIMSMTAELPVEICAPYLDKPKAWVLANGQAIDCPTEDTWSCYTAGPVPCGVCLACRKRKQAQ